MINKFSNLLQSKAILITVFISMVLGLVFLSPGAINVDELSYWQNAGSLINNNLKQDCNNGQINTPAFDYCVNKYNIGTSFFLIPAQLLGNIQFGLVTNLLAFGLSIVVFGLIIRFNNLSGYWVYLFALSPHMVFAGRTLFSEIYSVLFVLLVYLLLQVALKTHKLYLLPVVGILAATAIWVRYTNVVILFPAILLLLLSFKPTLGKYLSQSLLILLGIILPIIALFLFNIYLYGSPLRSGYYFTGEEGLTLNNIWVIFVYFVALNLIYPGMLLVNLLKNKQVYIYLIPSLVAIIFYSLSRNVLFTPEPIALILGLRFLFPIIPLLIIGYALSINTLVKKYPVKTLAIILILFAQTVLLHVVHLWFVTTRL